MGAYLRSLDLIRCCPHSSLISILSNVVIDSPDFPGVGGFFPNIRYPSKISGHHSLLCLFSP
jgi:hypothetical protein